MRLIDADELKKVPLYNGGHDAQNADPHFISGVASVMEYIDNMPTVDAEPVRHGRWVRRVHSTPLGFEVEFVFSLCKIAVDFEENYCPSCGAKMDLEGCVMTINEYQKAAMRTASGLSSEDLLINVVMGLAGESGECVDIVKKYRFQGHRLDYDHMAKELGDVAWYLAVTAQAIGYDLETVLRLNVEKLRKRYPDGFEAERSLHRAKGDV